MTKMEEQDIPIDINSSKLLEWLLNRRHCQKDWQPKILSIREKINNAIQDMPVHEDITKLLAGTHINYFHCKRIVEILKETEADTKNMFGRYGSQRMKDWQEIIRLYEKDNVYLAESAQMLTRNISYQVPGLKKQIQKLQQTDKEFEKKEGEYKKSENIARNDLLILFKTLGISGIEINKELTELVKQLPNIYKNITEKIKTLEDVVKFYSMFVNFTLGKLYTGGCVPMIKYIIENGNTTTYEWTYREAPLSIEEPSLNFQFTEQDQSESSDANEIDFGNLDLNDESLDLNQEDNINWGDINLEEVQDEINFDIPLEESGIVVESAGNDGGVARGSEALTILDNPDTRNDVINQLYELETFLKCRIFEMKNEKGKNILSMSHMEEVAPALQLATIDSVQTMLDKVYIVISEISDGKLKHLHNIKHSPRYVDGLATKIKQKQKLVKKMESMQQLMKQKQEDTQKQIKAIEPLLKLLIDKTKELQKQIEGEISKKYKNRSVHLTGGTFTL